jgi:hypothetical protein
MQITPLALRLSQPFNVIFTAVLTRIQRFFENNVRLITVQSIPSIFTGIESTLSKVALIYYRNSSAVNDLRVAAWCRLDAFKIRSKS